MQQLTSSNKQYGFSLLELLIVLTIVGILVTFSLIQISSSRTFAERENVAREFKIHLDKARADSIKRRAVNTASMASVSITANNSYTISMDFNSDGTIDAGEVRTIAFTYREAPQFLTTGITLPITIRYDWRGKATVVNGANTAIAQNITVRNARGASVPNATNATTILISTYGDASIAVGGSTAPTLSAPSSVTNVNANTNTRPYVQIN